MLQKYIYKTPNGLKSLRKAVYFNAIDSAIDCNGRKFQL